jgi:hypothetical protein
VPDGAQEALRDLTRAREDMKHLLLQSKQRLLAFLLRNGKRFGGECNWTKALHLAAQPELITPVLQVVQRVLSRHLLERAGLKASEGDCGSVTLIQRFGSADNLKCRTSNPDRNPSRSDSVDLTSSVAAFPNAQRDYVRNF